MNKYDPKRLKRKKHLITKRAAKRAAALTLCAAMAVSLVTFILPMRADAYTSDEFKELYIREADAHTMDSYLQASLGGYVDATTGPTVHNNFGTRYAGEVWADLSVFALDQASGDGSFNGSTLTLDRYTDGVNSSVEMLDYSDFLNVFSVLGSSQLVNDNLIMPLDVVFVLDTSASMSSTGEHNAPITEDNPQRSRYYTPAVSDHGNGNFNYNTRLEYAAEALNTAFDLLMTTGSPYNRVALVTYDVEAREVMELGRYTTSTVQRTQEQSGGYMNGQDRYFTIAQSSLVLTGTDTAYSGNPPASGRGGNNNRVYYDAAATAGGKYNFDNRFPQMLRDTTDNNITDGDGVSYPNARRFLDNGGLPGDWKVIEINAKNEKTGDITGINSEGNTDTSDGIPYLYTQSNTNTTAGLRRGMQTLAVADPTVDLYRANDGTLTNDPAQTQNPNSIGRENPDYAGELQRRPIVILLSDGAPNPNAITENWWDGTGDPINMTNSYVNNHRGIAVITSAIAAFWKKVINEQYFDDINGGDEVDDGDGGTRRLETEVYTFGFVLADPTTGAEYAADGRIARATLNPAGFEDGSYSGDQYDEVAALRTNYFNNNGVPFYNYSNNNATLQGTAYRPGNQTNQLYYSQQARDYDINDASDLNYPKEYHEIDDPTTLPNIFAELVLGMLGNAFTPIEGSNALGVDDSLTYANPVGEYMTVDGVTDLTMFGEHYKVEKYAVYDYKTNLAIRGNDPYITEGWYDKDNVLKASGNGLPTGCATSEEAWANGYTYRIRYDTAAPLIPTLNEEDVIDENTLPEKMKETTYTIYRITGQYQRMTPTVGEDNREYVNQLWTVQKELDPTKKILEGDANKEARTRPNLSYTASDYLASTVNFDLLDDIHIWVEDLNGYTERDRYGVVVDPGYDEALYVNLANNALPTQIATVSLFQNNNKTVTPEQYYSNLSDTWKSTPLRVYYDVSLDPAYLRYAVDHEMDKAYATGVAMADISAEYSKGNTSYYAKSGSFYSETAQDAPGAGRYTAFYTNFFSNNAYSGYPVTLGYVDGDGNDSDVSRGNPTVTFSAGDDNQFYRFQKNRVLFLIPGAYQSDERPSELELGDLANAWIGSDGNTYFRSVKTEKNGDNTTYTTIYKDLSGKEYTPGQEGNTTIIVDNEPVTLTKIDPNNFEDLAKVLNNKRANTDGEGTQSKFYASGKCIPVDGGTYTVNGEVLNQIDSENWYYIIREYYLPDFDGKSEGSTADKVSLQYMAIARHGSEFGSALGGRSMGEMVEWYHPAELTGENTQPFDGDAAHFGYPGGEDTVVPGDNGGHSHNGGWYVSAKPGALRVGSMSNFVGTKGYDIRQGVGEADFSKDPGTIAAANVTDRAKTYYLPGVSSYTDTSTTNEAAAMVIYLGNNGRILVPQSLLLVTKLVDDLEGGYVLDGNEVFTIEVDIEGFGFGAGDNISNERGAVVVTWDPAINKWRRTIDTITASTNPKGLLYGSGYSEELATVNVGGTDYYVYIPGIEAATGTTSTKTYNIYEYQEDGTTRQINVVKHYRDEEEEVDTGEVDESSGQPIKETKTFTYIDIYVDAWLIPVEGNDDDNWTFREDAAESAGYIKLEAAEITENIDGTDTVTGADGFLLATINPDYNNQNNADIIVDSGFDIDSAYVTKAVTFTPKTVEVEIEGVPTPISVGHAEIQLKSGQGLLFNTIANGAYYSVTEKLTGDQVSRGWKFESLNDNYTDAGQADGTDPWYDFNNAGYTYTVTGTIYGGEAYARYVNVQEQAGLNIYKEIKPEEGAVLTDADRAKPFTFTVHLEDEYGQPVPGPLEYTIREPREVTDDDDASRYVEVKSGHLISSGTPGENDIWGSGGSWKITLNHLQYINIVLPDGASYTVIEDPETGYVPKFVEDMIKDNDVPEEYEPTNPVEDDVANPYEQDGALDDAEDSESVAFFNVKQTPDPVTIDLTATKTVTADGDYPATEFTFTLTPVSGPDDMAVTDIPMPTDGNETVTITIDPSTGANTGTVIFENIKFTVPGTYTYTITETQGSTPGFSYDTTAHNVTVTVAENFDDGEYKLVVTVENGPDLSGDNADGNNDFDSGVIIENEFSRDAHITLNGIKTLTVTGANPASDEDFTFILTAVSGPDGMEPDDIPMPIDEDGAETNTAATTGAGSFAFDKITFTQEGTYTYTITERAGNAEGYTYDKTEYTVTVTVALGADGVLVPFVEYAIDEEDADEIEFVNLYNEPVDLTIRKTVTGSGSDPENDVFAFTVTLTAPDGVTLADSYDYFICGPGEVTDDTPNPEDVVIQSGHLITGEAQSHNSHDGSDNALTDYTAADGTWSWTVHLLHGQYIVIEDLPAGTTYTVGEADAPGYGTLVNGIAGQSVTDVILEDTTVSFVNYDPNGGILITKTVTGTGAPDAVFPFTVTLTDENGEPLTGTYPYTGSESGDLSFDGDGKAEITLRHGDAIQIEGLPVGAKVTVTEEPVNGFSMNVTVMPDGAAFENVENGVTVTIGDDTQTVITSFTNEWETGGLTVRKTVTGTAGDTEQYFTFTITLSDGDQDALNGSYSYTGTVEDREGDSIANGKITFADGRAVVELKHRQHITITGLPAGITYTVTETNSSGYTVTSTGETGTIVVGDTPEEASFINTKNLQIGNLEVTKTVTGAAGDQNKEFQFRVKLSDTGINGTYGDMTFVNGEAEFTLKHGESKTATGLPAGVTYTVTEEQDGYETTSTGATGTIPADGTATAEFVNHKDPPSVETTPPPEETTPPPAETTPPPVQTTPPPEETTPPPEESTLPPEETTPPPSPTLPPDIPKTGDESQLGLWLTLLGLSVIGVLGSLFYIVRNTKPADPEDEERK